ncbi:hypothetical protein D3C81_2160960 [compost metagenome]
MVAATLDTLRVISPPICSAQSPAPNKPKSDARLRSTPTAKEEISPISNDAIIAPAIEPRPPTTTTTKTITPSSRAMFGLVV